MQSRSSTYLDEGRLELTVRGIVLGALITLVFTAANVYLGLKVGLTFASSIPAAVISMAVLRAFKNSTIYENNIVQTVASAAGTLSSIIFVLPGLVMVGWWTGFPFWQSFWVATIGGVLGVMYTIPLRRAMVTTSDLPYPEGVAAAEVLKVGAGDRTGAADAPAPSPEAIAENRAGLITVLWGSIASGGFAAVTATGVFASEVSAFFRVGASASGIGVSLSLALMGAGHLIGLAVGIAIFVGFFIGWGVATPILTGLHPTAGAAAVVATNVWAHQVRFIGAGAIGISALWAFGRLARPVWNGVASALAASRLRTSGNPSEIPRTERDIPIHIVGAISLLSLLPMAVLLYAFLSGTVLASIAVPLVIGAIVYTVVAGFLVAAACGYMAGLIGSSNSPVSGLAILTVLGASVLLLVVGKASGPAGPALVAYALFVTAIVLCVATIANDNLQDLKTGQLVDATPWRQQVALVIGVVMGALVIPPILDLLNGAYGFSGAPHVIASRALAAPQATLISALAKGVIQHQLDWGLIGIGVAVGAAIIAIDEVLRRSGRKLPPLAVGLGIYLPASTTLPVVLGAIFGSAYNRWVARGPNAEIAKRLGVLLASGLIVGESLFGVTLAGIIVVSKKDAPLALVGSSFAPYATAIGAIVFIAVSIGLYRWVAGMARTIGQRKVGI
ncbi:MAG: oligopeptide transporter, OPT family [Candidatus Eremiobacteraeota bacterium]|nr:oligopeptide transporter, OPT family [Candidatus Eremiobacteraeota bacterium]